ncbi:Uma2 family endonuclease [Planktothrix sp. FACHB-1365]|uniref:Uma2 family endonuclease n=1 Tax=Planktothrix sp. FACHB-1365 TaxID=2692855 RepID=UPI0016849227|nr:Uma2 family endonuclease [Planktothrix sp. FACHB-1365]MBD2481595.1 Uma2 family endonuclease [Planktothrix sp. FACHB-1365]
MVQLKSAEIIYPEGDGKPMADNTKQFRWIVVIEQNLEQLYANDPNVFIAGDLFWYPVEGRNTIVQAPDVMIALGRPKGDRRSYKQWQEEGIAPQVVFEILSPCNSPTDMDKKLLFYDRYGVEEYYIYDPDTNQFKGWLRREMGLDIIEEINDWVSPRLGIRFDLSGEELQIYRPDGNPFLSYHEVSEQLEQERQRAEDAQQRLAEMETLLQQYRDRFGNLPDQQ